MGFTGGYGIEEDVEGGEAGNVLVVVVVVVVVVAG